MSTCMKCGSPLPAAAATGRPAVYCSAGCRRAAELEIKRLQTRLINMEAKASNVRLGYGLPGRGDLERITAEIDLAESRLRELLAAAPE